MKPITRTLPAEPRVLSEKERTARYIASDQTLDSYREIIRVKGWRFDRFALNSPFVDCHDYSSVARLLGNVRHCEVDMAANRLIEDVRFIPEGASALADFAWKMTAAGFLRAVSVGFMPLRIRSRWKDEKDFASACAELGLSADQAAQTHAIHWEQDQTELSAVLIGANPSAVALAHKSGAVSDGDLAGIGFRTADDLAFLHECAAGFEQADAITRRNIRAHLRGITAPENFTGSSPHRSPGNSERAAGAEMDAHARMELLAKLRALGAATAKAAAATGRA